MVFDSLNKEWSMLDAKDIQIQALKESLGEVRTILSYLVITGSVNGVLELDKDDLIQKIYENAGAKVLINWADIPEVVTIELIPAEVNVIYNSKLEETEI